MAKSDQSCLIKIFFCIAFNVFCYFTFKLFELYLLLFLLYDVSLLNNLFIPVLIVNKCPMSDFHFQNKFIWLLLWQKMWSSCCRKWSISKSLVSVSPSWIWTSSTHHTCIFCRHTDSVGRTGRPGPAEQPPPAEHDKNRARVTERIHREPGKHLNRKWRENLIKTNT